MTDKHRAVWDTIMTPGVASFPAGRLAAACTRLFDLTEEETTLEDIASHLKWEEVFLDLFYNWLTDCVGGLHASILDFHRARFAAPNAARKAAFDAVVAELTSKKRLARWPRQSALRPCWTCGRLEPHRVDPTAEQVQALLRQPSFAGCCTALLRPKWSMPSCQCSSCTLRAEVGLAKARYCSKKCQKRDLNRHANDPTDFLYAEATQRWLDPGLFGRGEAHRRDATT